MEKEDLALLRDWRNYTDFRKHFREVRELNLADQEGWFEHLQKTKNINFMFGIERLEDGKLVGACGLLYTNWTARCADVSFYIGEDKAYVEEVLKESADIAAKAEQIEQEVRTIIDQHLA